MLAKVVLLTVVLVSVQYAPTQCLPVSECLPLDCPTGEDCTTCDCPTMDCPACECPTLDCTTCDCPTSDGCSPLNCTLDCPQPDCPTLDCTICDCPTPSDDALYETLEVCPPESNGLCHTFRFECPSLDFPGYFMTVEQYEQLYNLPVGPELDPDDDGDKSESEKEDQPEDEDRKKRSIVKRYIAPGDGDRCCETKNYLRMPHSTAKANDDLPCYVIHCAAIGEWQLISVGECGAQGTCPGKCTQEMTSHAVVCLQITSESPYYEWRIGYVEMPKYCSCKNIGG